MTIYLSFLVFQFETAIRKHLNITGGSRHRPVEWMVTRVDIRVDREADRQVLVTVAELGHGDLLCVPPRICIRELIGGLVHLDHVIGICAFLTRTLDQQIGVVTTDAEPLLGA